MGTQGIPLDRGELLRRLRAAWDELDETVQSSDARRLTASPSHIGWTAMDHLSHIVVWLKVIEAHIEHRPEHVFFGLDAETYRRANVHALNEQARGLNQDRNVADLVRELREMHTKVVALIEGLSEADYKWLTQRDRPERGQLSGDIAADTYDHYREHLASIRSLIATQPDR